MLQGLKDCHVLTFSSNGSVSDHLVLHPQLDANNFIIKTVKRTRINVNVLLFTKDVSLVGLDAWIADRVGCYNSRLHQGLRLGVRRTEPSILFAGNACIKCAAVGALYIQTGDVF